MTERHDPEGAFVFWVEQAGLGVRQAILARFREAGHDISPGQWAVLNALWRGDGISQTRVARRAGRDKPGVTRLLEGLEARGLVRRERSEEDQRAMVVRLTDAGRELHAMLHGIVDDVAAAALAGLSAEARESLRRSLREVTLALKEQRESS